MVQYGVMGKEVLGASSQEKIATTEPELVPFDDGQIVAQAVFEGQFYRAPAGSVRQGDTEIKLQQTRRTRVVVWFDTLQGTHGVVAHEQCPIPTVSLPHHPYKDYPELYDNETESSPTLETLRKRRLSKPGTSVDEATIARGGDPTYRIKKRKESFSLKNTYEQLYGADEETDEKQAEPLVDPIPDIPF